MSGSRKEVLADAIRAEAGAASVNLSTLFTDDVVGRSPDATVLGLASTRRTSWLSVRKRFPTS